MDIIRNIVWIFLFCFFIPAQSATSITGTVTDSVTQLPISGAAVDAIRGNQIQYSTLTASDGTYLLPDVTPSNYTLVFNASGYQSYAVGVKPKKDQTTIANAELIPIGGTISGTVTSVLTSLPIANASVYFFQNRVLIASKTTNASGVYAQNNLAEGAYAVLVIATNFQEQIEGAMVTSGMTTTVDFALQSDPGSISGKVTDAITSNPIPETQIGAFSDSVLVGFATSDINGNYTIASLAPGNYIVVALNDLYDSEAIGASVASNMSTILNFALTQPPGTITGNVSDATTGQPIAGATISIFQDEIFILSQLTDPQGNYEIVGLAPGEYFVFVQANPYQSAGQTASVSENNTTNVSFSLLSLPGTISGVITDAFTTDPVGGAHVLIFSDSQLITTALSDPDGTYTIPNLSSGSYLVLVRANNYQAAFSSETVSSGVTTISDFALIQNPGAVEGQVLSLCNSFPIPGALVVVTDGSTIVGFTLTDTNGNYRIPDLAPGMFTITVAKQNFLANQAFATVLANISTQVNLTLTPKALNPPAIWGKLIKNRFLTQTEKIQAIYWSASPGSCVTGYQVFRGDTFLAFVSANSPLTYFDHNRHSSEIYTVKTVNSFGQVSSGMTIQL